MPILKTVWQEKGEKIMMSKIKGIDEFGLNPNGTHIGSHKHKPLTEIICQIHGSFFMSGENQDRIDLFVCPICKDPTIEEITLREIDSDKGERSC